MLEALNLVIWKLMYLIVKKSCMYYYYYCLGIFLLVPWMFVSKLLIFLRSTVASVITLFTQKGNWVGYLIRLIQYIWKLVILFKKCFGQH